jgi:hypothetical protein
MNEETKNNFEELIKKRKEALEGRFNWPKPGDKLKFLGKRRCFHINTEANADKLTVGNFYTVRECSPASSWCLIKLLEFPETDKFGEDWFALHFFDWNIEKPLDNSENGAKVGEMKDQIEPEFKERIKAALSRADESVKGLSVNELQELAEKGFEIANQ